jgi:hypothetical protein
MCLAPSEIPGVTVGEAKAFGAVAEDLIYADFCARYGSAFGQTFHDDHNLSAYIYFLARNNPQFTEQQQIDYFTRAWSLDMGKVPDLMVHQSAERAFYEVKPNSGPGRSAGIRKIDKLRIVYAEYRLPYVAGTVFQPRDHTLAEYGPIRVVLRVGRRQPGLILYEVCVESKVAVPDVATLAALLAYVIRQLNNQRLSRQFRPVDLAPVFSKDLRNVALALGITGVAVAAGVAARDVGWKFFWRAVVKRFAVRGAVAEALAVASGPIPVGELIDLGLGVWTVIDIVRDYDQLWLDAGRLSQGT